MALHFSSASSDQWARLTDHADFQSADVFTMLVWCRHDSDIATPSLPRIISKGAGTDLRINNITGTLKLDLKVNRSTTNASFVTVDNVVVASARQFIAVTFDINAGTCGHIYVGDVTTFATETSYATTNNGSGTRSSDSGTDVYIGSDGSASQPNRGYRGDILAVALIKGAALTLNQIRSLQFDLKRWQPKVWGGTGFFHLYTHGAGVAPDYSGGKHNGTITGSPTTAPGVGLRAYSFGDLDLAGHGTLGSTVNAAAVIAATSTVSAAASVKRKIAASIDALSALASAASVKRSALVSIDAVSALASAASVKRSALASIDAVSALASAASVKRSALASIDAVSTLSAVATVFNTVRAQATIAASSALTAVASVLRRASGSIDATSVGSTAASVKRSAAAQLSATSVLSASASVLRRVLATVAAQSVLLAVATVRGVATLGIVVSSDAALSIAAASDSKPSAITATDTGLNAVTAGDSKV